MYHTLFLKPVNLFTVLFSLFAPALTVRTFIAVYYSIIWSVLEYCCQFWHRGLTIQQSNELESVQKRCLKTIYLSLSYNRTRQITGLERLIESRERLVEELLAILKIAISFPT